MNERSADALIGQVIGDYRIEGVLGAGAMGRVYSATRLRLGQLVALKLLEPSLAADADFRARFEREWRLAASLNHPNVIPIFDAGEADGRLYLAMLPVEGGDLGQVLRRERQLEPGRALAILAQAARALDAAHQRGLVHRDVKPGNILLATGQSPSGDDHVYLADFGLTKRAGSQSLLTRIGTFVGTYAYAAPEQFGRGQVGPPADIYALGCVLFECLTGHVPFETDSDAALMAAHLTEPVPSLRTWRPDLPAALDAVIAKATAKQPAERYDTARAFIAEARVAYETGRAHPTPIPQVDLPLTVVAPPAAEQLREERPLAPRPAPHGSPPQPNGSRAEQLYDLGQQHGLAKRPPPRAPDRRRPYLIGGIVLAAVLGGSGLWALANAGQPSGTGTAAGSSRPFASSPSAGQVSVSPALSAASLAPGSSVLPPDDPLGVVTIPAGQPLHVAFWGHTSGTDPELGIDALRGVELAVRDRSATLLGHEIRFTTHDAGCSAEGGAHTAESLAADQTIVALLGPICSDEAAGGVELITAAGLTTISPANTRPALTDPARGPGYSGYLRTSFNDAFEGVVAAQFARDYLGASTAATIRDQSAYSAALSDTFADEFVARAGAVTAEESLQEGPVSSALTSIATSNSGGGPASVYYPIFRDDAATVTSSVRSVPGLESSVLISASAVFLEEFVDGAGPSSAGMFISSPDFGAFASADYDEFVASYRDEYGEEPISIFHAHAYDAANLLFAAIERVAVRDGDTVYVPKQALRSALYATSNFPGLTGTLSCSPHGDCGRNLVAMYEVQSDRSWPPPVVWAP